MAIAEAIPRRREVVTNWTRERLQEHRDKNSSGQGFITPETVRKVEHQANRLLDLKVGRHTELLSAAYFKGPQGTSIEVFRGREHTIYYINPEGTGYLYRSAVTNQGKTETSVSSTTDGLRDVRQSEGLALIKIMKQAEKTQKQKEVFRRGKTVVKKAIQSVKKAPTR